MTLPSDRLKAKWKIPCRSCFYIRGEARALGDWIHTEFDGIWKGPSINCHYETYWSDTKAAHVDFGSDFTGGPAGTVVEISPVSWLLPAPPSFTSSPVIQGWAEPGEEDGGPRFSEFPTTATAKWDEGRTLGFSYLETLNGIPFPLKFLLNKEVEWSRK